MRCLRCGYCCTNLSVVIVIDPDKVTDIDSIEEDNLRMIDLSKERCPHLRGNEPGEYSCAIHHYLWFQDTPCGTHKQIERKHSDCRIGSHIMKGSTK